MKMKSKTVLVLIPLISMLAGTGLAAEVSYINGRAVGDEGPPFSGAVMVDDTLYVSGALGLVDGQVPENPADEARAVLDSIKGTLAAAGMTWDDVVVVQVFCSDVSQYGAFNEVYRTYFTKDFPARAFIGSGVLLFDARFEVMVTAVKR